MKALLIIILLLTACQTNLEPETKYSGVCHFYGNEPYAYLGVLINDKVYKIVADKKIMDFFYSRQGATIIFYGIIKDETINIKRIDGL